MAKKETTEKKEKVKKIQLLKQIDADKNGVTIHYKINDVLIVGKDVNGTTAKVWTGKGKAKWL